MFLPAINNRNQPPPLPPGTVFSAGQIWMDRNLGASRIATSPTDSAAYGDLYQWGRLRDGHEKRTSPATWTLSRSDIPGHGRFIMKAVTYPPVPNDWRSPQNDNLWQGSPGINNPCPSGFRLPTEEEWETERLSWGSNDAAGAFASPLKLVAAGWRKYYDDGSVVGAGSWGSYWSSTPSRDTTGSYSMDINDQQSYISDSSRAFGSSVRCIMD